MGIHHFVVVAELCSTHHAAGAPARTVTYRPAMLSQ